jgi:small subunit ribosomal protein S12
MVTLNQLIRKKGRRKKQHYKLTRKLTGCPQKKGICVRVFVTKPKKPNSAQRKVAKIRLCTGKYLMAAIPGQGHSLQEHSVVLVRGGKVRDLPGVHYKLVRGVGDFVMNERFVRQNRRSKFGRRKEK